MLALLVYQEISNKDKVVVFSNGTWQSYINISSFLFMLRL